MPGKMTNGRPAMALSWSKRLDVDALCIWASVAACLLTITGAKFWLIDLLGSETPFWDDWGEATAIFVPYMDGTLRLADFFVQQNEHRIVFTRAASLALLMLNHFWNPVSEMKFNALIHIAAIGLFLIAIRRAVAKEAYFILCIFIALLIAIPFGWENTLSGFQSQFYFLLLFSTASLWLLHRSAAWHLGWWCGVLCAIAAYFSMASGALTVAAGIVIALAQMLLGRRRGLSEWLAVAGQAALFAAMVIDIPVVGTHEPLRAHSFMQFASAFFSAAHWPTSLPPLLATAILYAPVAVIAVLTACERPAEDDHKWFMIGMGVWVILQFTSLAYGRSDYPLFSRYLDIMVFGVVVSFLCLLMALNAVKRPAWPLRAFAAIWVLAVVTGAGGQAVSYLPGQLAEKHRQTTVETLNLSSYLATGDLGYLKDKPQFDIPFPSAAALAAIVSKPEIRAILPPSLLPRPDRVVSPSATWSDRVAAATAHVLRALGIRSGDTLLPLGVALFLMIGVSLGTSAAGTAFGGANRPPSEA